VVNGIPQDPFDGISLAYTFGDASAKGRKLTQYFEIMGSRAIYHDGFMASAFGPRAPWVEGLPPGIREWTPDKDKWELYNVDEDWSQANDLAGQMPAKLADLKDMFLIEAAKNNVLPIGGGLWIPMLHPELRISTPYKEWTFSGDMTRMPEFTAPALGNKNNLVSIDVDIPANANGVLYAIGGFSGGLSTYVKDGTLRYEYNLFEIQRTRVCSPAKLPTGNVKIEVETVYAERKPAGPLNVTLKANGAIVAKVLVPISAPLLFTANDGLDIGTDLGSPVSLDYFDKAPFSFKGKIAEVRVKYLQ
jgi:arylsulfatase